VSRLIACPECGESEELTGTESAEGIRILCGACGASWLRDAEPQTCATCGGTDVLKRPRALTQYSRGTQLSIVGMTDILLCRVCDKKMVEWSGASRAVPFNYRSAALDPDAVDEREGEDGDVLMTP
jgi:hypothetical protein